MKKAPDSMLGSRRFILLFLAQVFLQRLSPKSETRRESKLMPFHLGMRFCPSISSPEPGRSKIHTLLGLATDFWKKTGKNLCCPYSQPYQKQQTDRQYARHDDEHHYVDHLRAVAFQPDEKPIPANGSSLEKPHIRPQCDYRHERGGNHWD